MHQVKSTWSPYHMSPASMQSKLRDIWNALGFDHQLATLFRYEFDMLLLRTFCRLSLSHKRKIQSLQKRERLKIHLGCGNAVLPDWLNLDCYPPKSPDNRDILIVDMRQGLPLADNTSMAFFSEHFLEHLPYATVKDTILPEIFRILTPAGVVRISVPDAQYFIRKYIDHMDGRPDPLFEKSRANKTHITMLNDVAHSYGHKFLYDFETMALLMKDAGFINISQSGFNKSKYPCFSGLDRDEEWRIAMSLYIEAEKPS